MLSIASSSRLPKLGERERGERVGRHRAEQPSRRRRSAASSLAEIAADVDLDVCRSRERGWPPPSLRGVDAGAAEETERPAGRWRPPDCRSAADVDVDVGEAAVGDAGDRVVEVSSRRQRFALGGVDRVLEGLLGPSAKTTKSPTSPTALRPGADLEVDPFGRRTPCRVVFAFGLVVDESWALRVSVLWSDRARRRLKSLAVVAPARRRRPFRPARARLPCRSRSVRSAPAELSSSLETINSPRSSTAGDLLGDRVDVRLQLAGRLHVAFDEATGARRRDAQPAAAPSCRRRRRSRRRRARAAAASEEETSRS